MVRVDSRHPTNLVGFIKGRLGSNWRYRPGRDIYLPIENALRENVRSVGEKASGEVASVIENSREKRESVIARGFLIIGGSGVASV